MTKPGSNGSTPLDRCSHRTLIHEVRRQFSARVLTWLPLVLTPSVVGDTFPTLPIGSVGFSVEVRGLCGSAACECVLRRRAGVGSFQAAAVAPLPVST